MNNLTQLRRAIFAYDAEYAKLPKRAIFSKDGKPLLSWRVGLLPLLGKKDLFDQFRRDEPWDSAHNKPLIATMPEVFIDPHAPDIANGRTRYLVPTGKDTLFDGDETLEKSRNGLLVVEVGADRAVIWTKPDDMEFNSQKPLAGLGTIEGEAFLALFSDGHVQTIRKTIDADTMRRLVVRNPDVRVEPVWLQPGVTKPD